MIVLSYMMWDPLRRSLITKIKTINFSFKSKKIRNFSSNNIPTREMMDIQILATGALTNRTIVVYIKL